jgi:hypothetical protein
VRTSSWRALGGAAGLVAIALAAAAPSGAATKPKPVPTLQPAATQKLWRELVRQPHVHALTADCRPVRAVFYAQTDWLRLATKLASAPSPCAQYFVSVPPLSGDKTQERADQAWRIRALGPSFHALAEVNMNAWASWVTANASSWYAAGVEARRRMASAGYDVGLGDTWAVNELSSAVRRGDGSARQNARDFVRGLYDGGGAPAKGVVFVTGMAQSTSDLSTYKARLQGWLQDSAFWADMAAYVNDWSQETYGDVRKYAVAGAAPETRRDYLNEYLQHELTLANAGPDAAAAARAFLQSSYAPLANAAWAWSSAYGWTAVPFAQMQDYVSAETYALRSAGDRLGFAWAPSNSAGLASADFNAQTASILDRLAAAISAAAPDAACADVWCTGTVDGAAFTEAWKTFGAWAPPELAFASPPVTLDAGAPSTALTVQLQTAGVADPWPTPVDVTLVSTSPGGAFSVGASGPWAPTLTLSVAPGATNASFYYRDTAAGSPTITATADGRTPATQVETVAQPTVRVPSIAYATSWGRLGITFTSSPALAGTTISFTLYRNGYAYASGTGTTATDGTLTTWTGGTPAGCYTTALGSVTAPGYSWDAVTPANGFCK